MTMQAQESPRVSDVSPGPLAGIRVIDFGHHFAGPTVGMLLADQGADVLKVDPPGGPPHRPPWVAILDRAKTRTELDLRTVGGREEARRLIECADVVVENFRPGAMAGWGLDPDRLVEKNPRLVFLSLPGFAAEDAERSSLRAWEGVIAASVGQFSDMGLNRVLMGVNPSFSPLPLASSYGAVLGAMAATLALFARERDGVGDVIEVPLAAALMEGLAYNAMQIKGLPERYKSLREREIDRRRRSGEPFDLSYADLQGYLDPFYKTYLCGDGRPFYLVCASHASHPLRALEVLGLRDELVDEGLPLADPYLPTEQWPQGTDCTVFAYPLSRQLADRLSQRMATAFLRRSSMEWEQDFGNAGVPGCAHRTTREWLRSEHALASGLVVEDEDPHLGPMLRPGKLAWLESADDRGTVLSAAPGVPERGSARSGERAWLDGVRIIDVTNVIAGPTIAATLARFGAEVIKVDPPKPTFDPWNTIVFGMQANRGKRSMLVDLKTTDGKEILHELVRDADVVTGNVLDHQRAGMGLDPASLWSVNPRLVLCQLDAWGGPRHGPRSDQPGYDDLVQAATGIMARFGGSLQTPEEHAHFGTIDVLAGYCGAFATALALLRRARTGSGAVARTSLAAAGQLIQLPFMYDYEGRPPFDEPSGRSVLGDGPLYRCYRASDGWFFLATRIGRRPAVVDLVARGEVTEFDDGQLEKALEEMFRGDTAARWVDVLGGIGVAAHQIGKLSATRDEGLADSASPTATIRFERYPNHPSGYQVDLVAPCAVRVRRAPLCNLAQAPRYGAHTREVLTALGHSRAEIDKLVGDGTAGEFWSAEYLPS